MSTSPQPIDELSITVNQAAQDEIQTCAALAAAVEMLAARDDSIGDEYARALSRELARRLQAVYMNSFTPEVEVRHG